MMALLKIAYLSTHEQEINPLVAAFRELSEQQPGLAELYLRAGGDLRDAASLEEFICIASASHILILNLHGGKKSFEGFDHLVPVMHNADSYDEMAELEVLLRDYSQSAAEDPGKIPGLQKRIWEKVCEAKLDHDLGTDEAAAFSDFDGFLEKLHDYLHEISDTQIRDGLHTLGEPPEGSMLDEFLVALTRLKNGNVPSLRESVAELLGFDYDMLLADRGKAVDGRKTGGQVIEEIHSLCLMLVTRLHEENFGTEAIPDIVAEIAGRRSGKVEKVLEYIATSIAPDIAATTGEFDSVLAASGGCFVLPGPSGAPTRGMADILPTGRNFYSVDPRAIPSRAAWKAGVALGDALLDRYMKDEGKYPENIGMVVWGSPVMRTKGDDFYSYHGGMIAAVRAFKGEAPRSYSGDSSDPDRVKIRSTAEETKHIFRSRILNPKWIESMKRHGYKGAGDFSRMVDIVFGWDATAEVMEDWMYEALAGKYALDRDMQDWLKEVNPHALQNIAERLLEAIERGMWNATDEMKQELRDIYLDIEGMLEDDPYGKPQTTLPGGALRDGTRQMQRD
jgi:cobalamin biosynthesis Mg chelatase CobN